MYGSNEDNDAVNEMEDRYAQHNNGESLDRGVAGTGKKRKKGKKRPKVNIEPSASASI